MIKLNHKGDILKAIRLAALLTIDEVANKTKVEKGTLRQNERLNASAATVERFCSAFGVRLGAFYDLIDRIKTADDRAEQVREIHLFIIHMELGET